MIFEIYYYTNLKLYNYKFNILFCLIIVINDFFGNSAKRDCRNFLKYNCFIKQYNLNIYAYTKTIIWLW